MDDQRREVEKLLRQVRSGASDALGPLLAACEHYLLWIARREFDPGLQPKAGPSDIVQETLLEAYRDFGQFEGQSETEFLAWLRRLLLNNLANFARRYRESAKRKATEQSLGVAGAGPVEDLSSSTPSPEQTAISREQMELIEQAVERLPEDYRQVYRLWYAEELPFDEIGRRMGRSPNAARMLWMRALAQLQKELHNLGMAEGGKTRDE
jgi:RNA polymerase sigma-70 factor, ECF subfamily